MKLLYNRFAANTFQLAGMTAGAILFIFFLFSFTEKQQAAAEKLLGLTFDDEKKEVTIIVTSTGCTEKNYFQFKVRGSVIEVIRTKRDECKRMPFATSLTYSMTEAGIQPNKVYVIKNKFTPSPGVVTLP